MLGSYIGHNEKKKILAMQSEKVWKNIGHLANKKATTFRKMPDNWFFNCF